MKMNIRVERTQTPKAKPQKGQEIGLEHILRIICSLWTMTLTRAGTTQGSFLSDPSLCIPAQQSFTTAQALSRE